MSKNSLDFRNPEGLDTFNCFKRVCEIERNTNENFWNDPETKRRGQVVDNAGQRSPRIATVSTTKKTPRSSHKVQIENVTVQTVNQSHLPTLHLMVVLHHGLLHLH